MFNKYKDKNFALEQEVLILRKENETLKNMLPKSKILAMYPYGKLTRIAEREYGINCAGLTKGDVISEIIDEEKYLKTQQS